MARQRSSRLSFVKEKGLPHSTPFIPLVRRVRLDLVSPAASMERAGTLSSALQGLVPGHGLLCSEGKTRRAAAGKFRLRLGEQA